MLALLIIGIVLASLLVYTLMACAVGNYIYNHVRLDYDAGFIAGLNAIPWPITMWFVIAWALIASPQNRHRSNAISLLPQWPRSTQTPRGVRKELERRAAINDTERMLNMTPTVWHMPPTVRKRSWSRS